MTWPKKKRTGLPESSSKPARFPLWLSPYCFPFRSIKLAGNLPTAAVLDYQSLRAMVGSPKTQTNLAYSAITSANKGTVVMDLCAGRNVPLASVMTGPTAVSQILMAAALVTQPLTDVVKKLIPVRRTVSSGIQYAMTVSITLVAVCAPQIANLE
jgi:hypothetical protein